MNVSFSFVVKDKKYVYRHPGGTAGNLIDRQTEQYAQIMAKNIGIDKSVIKMDLSGWKISYFVENAKNCDFEQSDEQLEKAMKYLHQLHESEVRSEVKIFDNVQEGKKLMRIASATKGHLEKEFAEIIEKIECLYEYIKKDAEKLGYGLVLCHNDTYAPNYLYDSDGEIYLIDWEYAGMQDPHVDIAMFCIYSLYDRKEIDKLIDIYF